MANRLTLWLVHSTSEGWWARCRECRWQATSSERAAVEAAFDGHPCGYLGWWVISGDDLLDLLRRAHNGEDPDLLYAEEYANADMEAVDGD